MADRTKDASSATLAASVSTAPLSASSASVSTSAHSASESAREVWSWSGTVSYNAATDQLEGVTAAPGAWAAGSGFEFGASQQQQPSFAFGSGAEAGGGFFFGTAASGVRKMSFDDTTQDDEKNSAPAKLHPAFLPPSEPPKTLVTAHFGTPASKRKLLIVGDGGVGKTALVKMCTSGKFVKQYSPTMGVEVKDVVVTDDSNQMTFECWDCAGQQEFSGLGVGYYTGAEAAIVMFDVTKTATCNSMEKYFHTIISRCGVIPLVVIGNKIDCKEQRKIHRDTAAEKEEEQNADMQHFDTSVKDSIDIDKPFVFLMQRLLAKSKADQSDQAAGDEG